MDTYLVGIGERGESVSHFEFEGVYAELGR